MAKFIKPSIVSSGHAFKKSAPPESNGDSNAGKAETPVAASMATATSRAARRYATKKVGR